MDFEALLILLGLVVLLVPFAVIWLLFSHTGLRRKVEALSQEIEYLKSERPTTEAEAKADRRPATLEQFAVPEANLSELAKDVKAPSKSAPTSASASPPPLPTDADAPPRSFVFDAANVERFTSWMKENWFIAVAALSLAMSGIFLVQYGIENGILSPQNRVLCALAFGAGLIGFGEWIRRRTGDESDGAAAFLPSTFAGAGVVTLFSAVLSAQQMYGLIGQETSFVGLVGLAILSVVLGWIYGPFLTVIGLIGAVATPFIVSTGTSVNITWLFYYFALIAAIGLGVDAMKRSAWVSSIALIIPYIGATLLWLGSGSEHFIVFAGLVAACAICIPSVQLRPEFDGAMSFQALNVLGERRWPEFPTRLAAAGVLALAGVATLASMNGEAAFWLAQVVLFVALFVLGFWLDRTPTLDDLAIPVALAMLAVIGLQGLFDLSAAREFGKPLIDDDIAPPQTVTWLVAFGVGVSALAGWRSARDPRHALFWTAGAAVFAPATVILIALFWQPLSHLSNVQWASHVLGISVLMTLFAEQALRRDGETRLRAALYALAALNMIAFAMSVVLTETALTLGLAFIALSGAWLDRRFDIKPVTWFVQLGILACGYRLVIDPGVDWALRTSLGELCIGFAGTIAILAAVWWLLQQRERTGPIIVAESAIFSLAGIFLCLLIYRALDDGNTTAHWALSLFGMVWLISAAAQFYREQIEGVFRLVRHSLGIIFGTIGLLFVGAAATVSNPLATDLVVGPPVLDSLLIAYVVPGLLLGAVAWRFRHLEPKIRLGMAALGGGLGVLYVGLETRRLWQGRDLTVPGVLDGELYSYTIIMLLAGSAVLGLALLKKSATLRKAAIAIISLTISKVFLIDMSGLEGLIRVLSFLALGLVLAGLALLNRWITRALGEN